MSRRNSLQVCDTGRDGTPRGRQDMSSSCLVLGRGLHSFPLLSSHYGHDGSTSDIMSQCWDTHPPLRSLNPPPWARCRSASGTFMHSCILGVHAERNDAVHILFPLMMKATFCAQEVSSAISLPVMG